MSMSSATHDTVGANLDTDVQDAILEIRDIDRAGRLFILPPKWLQDRTGTQSRGVVRMQMVHKRSDALQSGREERVRGRLRR